MPEEIIANFILAVQQHPNIALLIVFLVAFSESLIIIGLIVPGAIFMVLIGALIALGSLQFWPTVIFAVCGAIAGDSLSYWLGSRYQNKILSLWPLSRHPEINIRANQFFNRHGVKGIIFSRFIGPLRPIIPAIAGISKMPTKVFLAANISSAIFWAPLYLLPGILFGLSVEVASEFAGKFLLIIIILLSIILLLLWSVQRLYLLIKPYNDKLITVLLNWGKNHPIAGQVPAAIFDETHTEVRGLSIIALSIFIVTAFIYALHNFFSIPYYPFSFNFDSLNLFIYYSLDAFRSPPFDTFMLLLSYITSSVFIAVLCFSWGVSFIYRKRLYTLWHWLAAIALPLLLSLFVNNDLTRTLQNSINIDIPSLPSVVIVSIIGFSTMIINAGFNYRQQKIFYYFSATLVLLLSLAQLYFAFQVFSQIIFGLLIGTLWFSLLGIAYRRHAHEIPTGKIRKEYILILCLMLTYPIWKTTQHHEIHSPSKNYFLMGRDSWLESGWNILPISRQGIHYNENNLFNLQWMGTRNSIYSQLTNSGFKQSIHSDKSLPNLILQDVKITDLPLLPHIHSGEYETLRFYKYSSSEQTLTVIRLWPSIYQLKQDGPSIPLWFGSISSMEIRERLGLKYLATKKEKETDIKKIIQGEKIFITSKTIYDDNKDISRTLFLLY